VHLANVKGPVRDVLIRSGLWSRLGDRIHPSIHLALGAIGGDVGSGERAVGLDERSVDRSAD
jgi:sulfate permease, SulP family